MKTFCGNDDPYAGVILKYFNQEFPQISNMNHSDKIDIICDMMVGTKEIRYDCLPNPESLVTIRKTIRESIVNDVPIPVLVPWGSMKGDYSGNIDVAEVSAINRIIQLNKAVSKVHKKGLDISIRVEDTSGYMLFAYDCNLNIVQKAANDYCSNFARLIQILDTQKCITISFESAMKNSSLFAKQVEDHLQLFEDYLFDTHEVFDSENFTTFDSYKELNKIGWKGIICKEQRDHYYSSYTRLYKDSDISISIKRLALYFCQSFVRSKLNMVGNKDYWESYITISFVSPIKGLPEGYHNNRLYYRTLPMSQARTHMCPWRSKGYLQINGNSVCAKLTTFNNKEIISQLYDTEVTLSEGITCPIQVSYHVID